MPIFNGVDHGQVVDDVEDLFVGALLIHCQRSQGLAMAVPANLLQDLQEEACCSSDKQC